MASLSPAARMPRTRSSGLTPATETAPPGWAMSAAWRGGSRSSSLMVTCGATSMIWLMK
jgi:hypothetical protein